MNILITGGAGFIGSHVVRLFVTKYPQYRIVNLAVDFPPKLGLIFAGEYEIELDLRKFASELKHRNSGDRIKAKCAARIELLGPVIYQCAQYLFKQ